MQPPVQLLHKRPQSFSLGGGDFLGGGAVHTFYVFVCNDRTCKLHSLPAGRNCVGTFLGSLKICLWTDHHTWWGGQMKGTTKKENRVLTIDACG